MTTPMHSTELLKRHEINRPVYMYCEYIRGLKHVFLSVLFMIAGHQNFLRKVTKFSMHACIMFV